MPYPSGLKPNQIMQTKQTELTLPNLIPNFRIPDLELPIPQTTTLNANLWPQTQNSIVGYNPFGPLGPTTFIGNNGQLPQITWGNPGGPLTRVNKKPEPIWWGIYAQPDQIPNGFSPSMTGFPGFQGQGGNGAPKYIGVNTPIGGWGYSELTSSLKCDMTMLYY